MLEMRVSVYGAEKQKRLLKVELTKAIVECLGDEGDA